MKRTVRRAARGDLPIIMRLIEDGKAIMRRNGNMLQWSDGYPQKEVLLRDIDRGQSFLLMDHEGTDSRAIATWAFISGPDVTYNEIERGEWTDDVAPYYVIHRVASRPDCRHVLADIMAYCFSVTNNIRVDTHRDNTIMQHALLSLGFRYCGIIHLLNGDERLAYQRIVDGK